MLSGLTPDVPAALGGPEWLQARRAAAAEALVGAELPTTDEEVWRYSRVDDVDLAAFQPAAAPADAGVPAELDALLGAVGEAAATVVARNGRVVEVHVREDLAAKGLSVGAAGDGDEAALGAALVEVPDPFVGLNEALAAEPIVVRAPAGLVVDAPVVVAHWTEGEGTAAFPRLVVTAGADSELSVLEVQASGPARSLVVPVTEIAVGPAARVGHVTVQQLGMATWQIGLQVSAVEAEATLRSSSVGFGGDYTRMRTDCRLTGRGASGELDAVYFGEGDQMLDFRTHQDHLAPDCTSNLLFKGAVGGRSQSVYTGMIRVAKDAVGTNAFQTNRNVKLSEDAWALSVPNLQIENNDVRCSHASAVGPVDEEQAFYLQSRGVPEDVAERLIVTGFFDEVVSRLPVPSVAPLLRRTVAAKFERREG